MCLYFGVRCVWMCGSFGGAVHVNSGVREGSPSRRSYEGCATIVYPTSKTVSAIWPKCMGVHSLIWLSVLKAYGSFKCVCKIEIVCHERLERQKRTEIFAANLYERPKRLCSSIRFRCERTVNVYSAVEYPGVTDLN